MWKAGAVPMAVIGVDLLLFDRFKALSGARRPIRCGSIVIHRARSLNQPRMPSTRAFTW